MPAPMHLGRSTKTAKGLKVGIAAMMSLSAILLLGCAAMRPEPVLCGVEYFLPTSQAAIGQPAASMAEATMTDVFRGAMDGTRGPLEIEVLALSAGGQFGSFGAGFLRGWGENTDAPRPDFDLVTGVSAGAMIAPVVFAGTAFDDALDGYRGLSESEVFRSRSWLSLLSAPSFTSIAPLERFLSDRLSDDLINEIGRRHDSGQGLLILATDLDDTDGRIFDLGAMAASNRGTPEKRDCMTEAMLASAAIPGLFPPRHIDGTLFADGGLRDQIFLRTIEGVRKNVSRSTGRDVRVSATIIVNGALRPPAEPVDEGLLAYARRGALILADEVLRDSIGEVVAFADDRPNWTLRGVFADTDLSACGGAAESGTFDACVTRRLFDDGRAKGRASSPPWLSSDELLELANRL
ncbi:MAG: patatin-like phospholipase family protein [Pseudomonadota bacterium]